MSRRVRFARKVRGQLIMPLSEYSEAEVAATWYNEEEEREAQGDVLDTVRCMRSPQECRRRSRAAGESFTPRGLEHMASRQASEDRKQHKAAHVEAVLNEQDRQWDEGMVSVVRLAQASMAVSKSSQDKAIVKGKMDAVAAAAIVQECQKREPESDCHKQEQKPRYSRSNRRYLRDCGMPCATLSSAGVRRSLAMPAT